MRNLLFTFLILLPSFTSAHFNPSDNFILFLVDAKQLDTKTPETLWSSLSIPRTIQDKGLGVVGHAWVYLHVTIEGETYRIEGGHSGDLGENYPRYFDAVTRLASGGSTNQEDPGGVWIPDPNPIRILYKDKWDGFFQEGSGGHSPTLAVKVKVNEEQAKKILACLNGDGYLFERYNLVSHQCCSFTKKIASILELPCKTIKLLELPSKIKAGKDLVTLWTDQSYAQLPIETPSAFQEDMEEWTRTGRANFAYMDYKKLRGKKFSLNPLIRLFQKRKMIKKALAHSAS